VFQPELDLLQVEHQVLDPERGALADGGRLRGLEVGEAEGREVAVATREVGERRDHAEQPPRTSRSASRCWIRSVLSPT
jgi:hypothetical protein